MDDGFLNVAEIFGPVVQGEGFSLGVPASFIRVSNCNLMCGGHSGTLITEGKATWHCDTEVVWRQSSKLGFEDIKLFFSQRTDGKGLTEWQNLLAGKSHFVLTGGEPTLPTSAQSLVKFMEFVKDEFDLCANNDWCHLSKGPFFELETNGSRFDPTSKDLLDRVDQINCSPKLSNSGMPSILRINPNALRFINDKTSSWFKFVISGEEDWAEIERDYLRHVSLDKVILMPACYSLETLPEMQRRVWDIAVKNHVRLTTRLQVLAWDKTTGV